MIRQFTIAVLIMSLMFASSTSAGTWRDGFEYPNLDDWEIHLQVGNQPVWKIENGLLLADHSGVSAAWIGTNSWGDYSVEATVTLLEKRPPGPLTPNSCGAGIVMYWKILPCQGHHYGIFTGLWDGRGAGVFAVFANGWGPAAASKYQARKIHLGSEYHLRMTEEKDLIKCYLDGELVLELKKRFTSGVVFEVYDQWLWLVDKPISVQIKEATKEKPVGSIGVSSFAVEVCSLTLVD